jgi:acetyltransferase-like isoleucine patch superfamily enzyme
MIFLERAVLGLAMYLPVPTLKRSLYRICGAHVGRDVHVAPNVVINCLDMKKVRIEDHCSMGLGVWIRCKSIEMHQNAKIAGGVFVYGKESVAIGQHAYIGHKALLDCWDQIVLEDFVQIAPGAMILTHDSSHHYISGEKIRSHPTVLRERSYIGAGAIIFPGVEIGSDAIIGAGAIVTKSVSHGSIVRGNPAADCGSATSGPQ